MILVAIILINIGTYNNLDAAQANMELEHRWDLWPN